MITVHSPSHRQHHGKSVLFGGELVPCHEAPIRADAILDHIAAIGLGPVLPPLDLGGTTIARIHSPAYLRFLETIWADWTAAGNSCDALPFGVPTRGMRQDRVPDCVHGRLGYFSFDACAPINAGTWVAAWISAQTALTAQRLLHQGEQAAFALCRPPGHHAGPDYCGGFCFLNNAAIAAQGLLESGARRVALLDVDFHHGNGTQTIFYGRDDVLFLSIHGDPASTYPYFLGHVDETGTGRGEGYNINLPLPPGAPATAWFSALEAALIRIERYRPDAIVISLGVDAFEDDPISSFRLTSDDFRVLGRHLARLHRPTLFVMEGGYALEAIGRNVGNVLTGFEQG